METRTIIDTFKKIEQTLDLRFEENSALYISKEDTEKIKESLSKNNYSNIFALAKKHGCEIVSKIILKNSWLINYRVIKRNKLVSKSFYNIFNDVPASFFIQIAKPIIEDTYYSSIEFKSFIEDIYYDKIDKYKCNKIYTEKTNKIENRTYCFVRYLKEVYMLEESTIDLVRFINREFENYPEIHKYLNSIRNKTLEQLFNKIKDRYTIAKWILDNKINEIIEGDKLWENGLSSLATEGLETVVEYVGQHHSDESANVKYIIQKILATFYQNGKFEGLVIELYKKYSNIRSLLIRMLKPPKFKSTEVAKKLVGNFEQIASFHPNWQKDIDDIRNGEKKESVFSSATQVLEKINSPNTNLLKRQTLAYFSIVLSKSDFSILKELYEEHGTEKKVSKVLTFYLADLFRNIGQLIRIDPYNKIRFSKEYIGLIAEHIGEMYINNKHTKVFLEKNKQYKILEKLNRR